MKYLKTYEEINTTSLQLYIGNWLRDNRINSIDLIPAHIKELTYGYPNNKWYLKTLYRDNGVLYIRSDYLCFNELLDVNNKISDYSYNILQNLLNYLYSLSDEDIEQIRANQEAEKFNF